jgi:hypothetical protein
MSNTFESDPTRFNEAIGRIKDLGDLIDGFRNNFSNALSNAREILGHDQFGSTARQVLEQQQQLLEQATDALSRVAGAVPRELGLQQEYIKYAQQKVRDSIHDAGSSYQAEGLPETGKPGRY